MKFRSISLVALLTTTLLATTLAAQNPAAQYLADQNGSSIHFQHANIIAHRLADIDGDGRQEILLVCHDLATGAAKLISIGLDANNQQLEQRGEIALPDPAHTLIAVADLLPEPGDEITIATPARTACVPWTTGKGVIGKEVVLARSARFRIRIDRPQLSPFVIDLNRDGLLDLMLPSLDGVQPFFQEKLADDGVPVFRRMDHVAVPIATSVGTGSGGLDQELTGSIRIPQINTEDMNGDGRPDLLTRTGDVRAFHMQRVDGTFADPITIDITQFVDSTPKAAMDLGTTAVLSDAQLMQRGDINGDGIPDHVIAHRRKIWTFLGDSSGPQFQKARTQAVADDVTALLLVDLDRDKSDDLLTFRVQLPSLASIVLGLVQSIDIDVRAIGYQSEQDGFASTPKWRRTVTIRVPPLLSLLSRQDELIERFTGLVSKARISTRGEFVSKGQSDLALVTADNSAIELFLNVPEAPQMNSDEGSKMLGKLLFEDDNTLFDLERVFGLLSGFLDQLNDQTVGARKASKSLPLRNATKWLLSDLDVGEFDGLPGKELLLTYHSVEDPELRTYDVISFR